VYHWRSSGFCPGTTSLRGLYPIAGVAYLHRTNRQQYADDTQLFISLSPSNYTPDLNNLTICIDALHVWFCVNGTLLNPDKSEAILTSVNGPTQPRHRQHRWL